MKTLILNEKEKNSTEICANIIRNGGLCAFPTETVYGLGANGLCAEAVKKIFTAKGRPQDNPLILHVASFSQAQELWRDVPCTAKQLADVFWGGALTIICKKSTVVPDVVCAGLDTVAVRMPENECARRLIQLAGVPIAAPSANLSGKPSPTKAEHVIADMEGRVDAILCGEDCKYGIESTVISLAGTPTILRPGAVTPEMISAVIGEVCISESVLSPLKDGETAASPGMKYKHYAPDAKVIAASGTQFEIAQKLCRLYDEYSKSSRCVILASTENSAIYGERAHFVIGSRNNPYTLCAGLFAALRKFNDFDIILCETTDTQNAGLAYMNRLLRASGFCVV